MGLHFSVKTLIYLIYAKNKYLYIYVKPEINFCSFHFLIGCDWSRDRDLMLRLAEMNVESREHHSLTVKIPSYTSPI